MPGAISTTTWRSAAARCRSSMTKPASCDRFTGWRASGCADRLASVSSASIMLFMRAAAAEHAVEVVVADAVEHAAVVFLQDAREAFDDADRRAQVVRDGVAEGGLLAEQLAGFGALQRQARRGGGRGAPAALPPAGPCRHSLRTGPRHRSAACRAAANRTSGGAPTGRTATSPNGTIDSICARRPVGVRRGVEAFPHRLPAPVAKAPGRGRRAGRRLQPLQPVMAVGLPLPHIEQLGQQLAPEREPRAAPRPGASVR